MEFHVHPRVVHLASFARSIIFEITTILTANIGLFDYGKLEESVNK